MKIKTYNVYSYDELTDEQKKKVLNNYWDLNVDYEWWDYLFDDAKIIGLEITGFDLDRLNISGKLLQSVGEISKRIIENHGKNCRSYRIAVNYFEGQYSNGDEENDKNEFLSDLLSCYLKNLRQDYEYFTSKECIEETIRANEYEFNEDGEID